MGMGNGTPRNIGGTLTGMRVRITECHPYSAGLAAVSGQCYRYISIITFGRAAQRSTAFRCIHSVALAMRLSRPPLPLRISRADLHRDVFYAWLHGFSAELVAAVSCVWLSVGRSRLPARKLWQM